MYRVALFLIFPFALIAQQLVSTYTIDTLIYSVSTAVYVNQAPVVTSNNGDYYSAYRKKNSDQVDIFNFKGKVTTINVPFSSISTNPLLFNTYVSQTFIDGDLGWESAICYFDTTGHIYNVKFKLFDDNGTLLLSDNGYATFVYDGHNTYVYAINNYNRKVWQFLTNVAITSPSLQKQTSLKAPSVSYNSNGVFRIALNTMPPSGVTTIQLFNLLGQQIYSYAMPATMLHANFTIPIADFPNSPFITNISNENGDFNQKIIPTR